MSKLLLGGIDGANPLAYLSALGVIRLLALNYPTARLAWERKGRWVPVLTGMEGLDADGLISTLLNSSSAPFDFFDILGKNITVPQDKFRQFAAEADRTAFGSTGVADFVSAFGSEACVQEKLDRIQYTSFCFITGSGHQDFLETARSLRRSVQPSHIYSTLFEAWKNDDRGLSFRWDPSDAREYALRWNNPGPEGVSSQWGANFLAFEALPMFPTQPGDKFLETTGFRESKPFEEFTWPIWEVPLPFDVVRSLVALNELYEPQLDRDLLTARGIVEVFRSQRIRIGAGANFKVSFRPSRAL